MINHNFNVRVITHYVEQQSDPSENRYVFSYTITIENNGKNSAQLLRRKWLITDANAKKIIIEGDGVVGEQPIIHSNDEYTYTSGAMLDTEVGVMEGFYTMRWDDGEEFEIEIKPFLLSQPNILH